MNNLKTFYRLDQVSGISTEDILRYAIDGHLTLSVNLTKKLAYQPCELYQEIDPLIHPDAWLIANKETLRVRNTLATIDPADSKPLDVIINSGNVREQLEFLFIQLPSQNLSSAQFGLVKVVFKNGKDFIIPMTVTTRLKAEAWKQAFLIPEDGYLVITKENLDAFKAKLATPSPKVIKSDTAKPWLTHNPNDPIPELAWHTPARYFARKLIAEDVTLLTNRNRLANKIAETLPTVGIYKRGGKIPLDAGTIKKALTNINFG